MKKVILTAILGFTTVLSIQAQEISKNALGLRFSDNDGFGTEISYQRALQKNNRLEFDLGWRSNHDFKAFKVVGLYEWVWNIEGGFNWYAGVGAGIGSWKYKGKYHKNLDSGSFGLVTGTVGIEYNFDIPLQISLDFRPEMYFNDDYRDGIQSDFGLAIRYKF
ncbi:hypothetical protein [Flavobacterium sp. NKUCC04_CG]|uniref:hypothetical protein n=1 Tax=Flavobacterium sp. NKUCC04_CG TaxID=2842121 RepID=UPI001C5ABCBC|nr:hypothetical protein [Flavobacterium sp. NKUCC04_CG]MBW3518581.1 outer membrane beta-barrel protein [Flavobacterium sp. NKUCC04_CG]